MFCGHNFASPGWILKLTIDSGGVGVLCMFTSTSDVSNGIDFDLVPSHGRELLKVINKKIHQRHERFKIQVDNLFNIHFLKNLTNLCNNKCIV